MTCVSVEDHASPFAANPGGRTGVVFCHGFTGSPASLRPWAEALAGRGLRVDLPRLPGHGTHWREMNLTRWPDWYSAVERSLLRLQADCDRVFVAGLSMGGALALRLAEQHPVAGVMVVNPAIGSDDRTLQALPVLRHLRPSVSALGNDIALEGADEHAYPRTPLHAAWSMTQLWRVVVPDLGRITAPALLMVSDTDHVVDGASRRLLRAALPQLEELALPNSFHVATLDHDAHLVEQRSLEFIAAHGGVLAPESSR